MAIQFSSSLTVFVSDWTAVKAIYTSKNLWNTFQYVEDDFSYEIFAIDVHIVHSCAIWKSAVPGGIEQAGYSQAQNDLDLDDFVNNYKALGNKAIEKRSSDGLAAISLSADEQQYTITGSLYTDTTAADQTIISYTVPAGKSFYVIGYNLWGDGSAEANAIKIGISPLGDVPSAPGSIGNLFRYFSLDKNSYTGEVSMGAFPRKIGGPGSVVQVAVTPSSKSKTLWYAALDFVLR